MNAYLKAIIAALVSLAGAFGVIAGDGVISAEEIGALVGIGVGSFGLVWAVPNSVLRYAKAVAGAIAGGGAALIAAQVDGAITGAEWYTILFAVLAGIAVERAPNEEPPPEA